MTLPDDIDKLERDEARKPPPDPAVMIHLHGELEAATGTEYWQHRKVFQKLGPAVAAAKRCNARTRGRCRPSAYVNRRPLRHRFPAGGEGDKG